MNSLLKGVYDRVPVVAQNAMLSVFSAYTGRRRYGGRFGEFRTLLEASEWWTVERRQVWQLERLREVLRHAQDHVPYYQALFKRTGFNASKIQSLEDLSRLPVLERETLKNSPEDLVSRHRPNGRLVAGHTSGTTGSPIVVYYDANMITMNYAAMDRQYRWAGLRLGGNGDRIAVVRGNVIVPLRQRRPPYWRFNRNLNQLLFSSFHLSPDNLVGYLDALRHFQPAAIDGYPSSLYVLARFLIARSERLPLRAAITSSETLYDFQREAIEEAFGCRVFDYYAAAERVIFTTECDRHSGHHLCEEYGITEVLDDDGRPVKDGADGYLVGTTLHNFGMPLIRYRTTDRASVHSRRCACGRTLNMTSDVTTKAEDFLRLSDGRLIPPSVLTHPFKPLTEVEGSQIIQTDLDRLVVKVVPGRGFGPRDEHHLKSELTARLGAGMRIDVELVNELPRTKRGKFKWVVSNIPTGL